MTPERIAELRAYGVAWCTETQFEELLDEIERLRARLHTERCHWTHELDAVKPRLEAADRLAEAVQIILDGYMTVAESLAGAAMANMRGVMRSALSAYREASK